MVHIHDSSRKVKTFRNLKFFAERGLVRIIRETDGEYTVLSVKDFARRIKALNEIAKTWPDLELRAEMVRAVEELIEVAKTAKAQGSPNDPDVIAHLQKHGNGKVQKGYEKTIILPDDFAKECEDGKKEQ